MRNAIKYGENSLFCSQTPEWNGAKLPNPARGHPAKGQIRGSIIFSKFQLFSEIFVLKHVNIRLFR